MAWATMITFEKDWFVLQAWKPVSPKYAISANAENPYSSEIALTISPKVIFSTNDETG